MASSIVVIPETPPTASANDTTPNNNLEIEDDTDQDVFISTKSLPHRTSTTSSTDVEVLDDEPRSILLSLISQLTYGMDLHKVTLPTFVLETRSMCERITDFMSHPDLITGIPLLPDPLDRFIGITRFFLSGWHIRPKGVKKPYNPVLGEFFRCTWTLPDKTTSFYICEQVSHHPPISTYAYINPHHQFHISGDLRPKSRFLGNSAATLMQGSTRIQFKTALGGASGGDEDEFERYTITFPNMYARGILFGTMYTELGDHATITCEQTDLSVQLDFKTRGVFSDRTLNVVEGDIKKRCGGGGGGGVVVVAHVSGKWSDDSTTSSVANMNRKLLFDANSAEIHGKIVPPETEMESFESRRLWKKVTKGIQSKNLDEATSEKTAIEENQRKICKLREERDQEWKHRFFIADGDVWRLNMEEDITKLDPAIAAEKLRAFIFAKTNDPMHKDFWVT
ncbi:hypothetical protein BDR26DRAFT_797421 [Obelidium mucronatum]|nr:hypothetical protein BDR26DRAFT_797421 [Obelidium mucronatum]